MFLNWAAPLERNPLVSCEGGRRWLGARKQRPGQPAPAAEGLVPSSLAQFLQNQKQTPGCCPEAWAGAGTVTWNEGRVARMSWWGAVHCGSLFPPRLLVLGLPHALQRCLPKVGTRDHLLPDLGHCGLGPTSASLNNRHPRAFHICGHTSSSYHPLNLIVQFYHKNTWGLFSG